MGRIGQALGTIPDEKSPLQREIGRIVRRFAVAGLAVCALVVVLYARSRGSLLEGLLAGLAVAMSVLPEEFPVVLTVFLALGAWRISRRRVLTRRIPAVEALGAATVLCVDKTGTLTQNRMAVARLYAGDRTLEVAGAATLPEEFHELLEFAILASQRTPFDPMEQAIRDFGLRALARTEHLHEDWELLREYPLSPELLAVSHAWKARGLEDCVIAAKGAPEAIADLCHLPEAEARRLTGRVEELAREGLRVLAVAKARFRTAELPPRSHDFRFELLGLVGLEDPLRPSARAAIEDCRTAGIRVVMITGDYPVTAARVAREIGLPGADPMTGAALDALDDDALSARIDGISVFARIVPAQKLRLVEALKARGEVVVMTGDGVNDAPALKAAHIGIAMGGRGTDVAREAASLVLLNDDFSSIVAAVRLGRRIFDNIKKAIAFILAVHVPIAGLSMLPVFFRGWPLLLLPVHIVFLELIIDPSCSLIFEAENAEANVMQRPPRKPDERLFSARTIAVAVLQGLSVFAACILVFLLARGGHTPEATRALTFATLVAAFLVIIMVNRSWTRSLVTMLRVPNAAFRWVVAGTAILLAVVLFVPVAQRLFHFAPVHLDDLGLSLVAGLVCVLWFEALKRSRRGRLMTSPELAPVGRTGQDQE